MGFRFLRLATLYPGFVRQVWRQVPAAADYRTGFDLLVAERFAESDHHARHLRRLGHTADTRFISVEPLQRLWAEERQISVASDRWCEQIAIAQVREFRPDVLLLDDLYRIDGAFRAELRRACPKGTLLVGWRAAPTNDFAAFRDLDLLLSSIQPLVSRFRQAGVAAELLHHGFEASILEEVQPPARDLNFTFAGSLESLHTHRAELIESLLPQTPLQIWGGGERIPWKDRLRGGLRRLGFPQKIKSRMRCLPLTHPGRVHPAAYGKAYYEVLGRSKIALNQHISCAEDWASNMRMFEATGMGACLVTDDKHNLPDLFEPDVEVVTYRSPAECAEKVRYLLEHDRERAAIAAAGQRRVLRVHRFGQRVERLVEILERRLAHAA